MNNWLLHPLYLWMTATYKIEGMNCGRCAAKIEVALSSMEDIQSASVSKASDTATLSFKRPLSLETIQESLTALDPKYKINSGSNSNSVQIEKSWFEKYKPVILIFAFVTLVTGFIQLAGGQLDFMVWMRHFMAGFFLSFSFFKFLDLQGFATNYKTYDILARHFPIWGYIYPFVELGLGLAYLLGLQPLIINLLAFTVMSVSIIGVLQSVLRKKEIQCACLGTVFDLPMSTVTIIEDALMILMSGIMIIYHLPL